MHQTRKHFSQDRLIATAHEAIRNKLLILNKGDEDEARRVLNSAMSALALFTFKFPSLLKFDRLVRVESEARKTNIHTLFNVGLVPCDTYMRATLDPQLPEIIHTAPKKIFTLLQRGSILRQHFQFLNHYLVSLDGTGYFSSPTVHCENCCVKEHKNGSKTYYHQMLAGAIVCPWQKVALPFASPEPIMNTDGATKNDCERNAAKRWIPRLRREHPFLPIIIVADGLSSNAPFIKLLGEHSCRFILVCQESDHEYLTNWVNAASAEDAPTIECEDAKKHLKLTYQYMKGVPLNDSNSDVLVNVVKMWEHNLKTGQTRKWMWATDLNVTRNNVRDIAAGGRARWKIENETFNTLKNQGYEFEHNFGHGEKNLSTIFACLMLLAFFIDQCLQLLNVSFQAAYARLGAKDTLWEEMRSIFKSYILPSLEKIYELICHPPPPIDLSGRSVAIG